jgi:hypothetical protein
LADSVLSFVKEYLFPCFKFLKDRWMEYDKGQDHINNYKDFNILNENKVRINYTI